MNFGEYARGAGRMIKALGLSLALMTAVQPALAAPAAPAPAVQAPAAAIPAPVAPISSLPGAAASDAASPEPTTAGSYTPMTPTPGVGMPVDGGITLQKQYSPTGEYAHWIHDAVLMPLIVIISLFVLFLLLWVMARYNKRANPVASKTSHNTFIEVIWTLVPVLILVGIAVPSIDLLAKQYKPAPARALTIKATGNQWFWTYSYPDNGEFEITSYMLNIPGKPTINNGVRTVGSQPWDGPAQLEVDNRMVVPAGEPIRLQVTATDVIHAFGVPSLWFKIDAVPGKINERVLFVEKPGVYYGQCYELCGAKHAYMPVVVEALPRAQFNAWVLSQSGGKIDGQPEPAAAPAGAPAVAPAASEAAPASAAPAPAASASAAPAA